MSTTSSGPINRPFSYGPDDRRELIVQDSEVALRAQNDASGNPLYIGRAKSGTLDSEVKWQIQFLAWDANDSVTSVTWPENSDGKATTNYQFEWDERTNYTYS